MFPISSHAFCDDNEHALLLGRFSLGISTLIVFLLKLTVLYITRCRGCSAKKITVFPPFEINITSISATKLALLIFFLP